MADRKTIDRPPKRANCPKMSRELWRIVIAFHFSHSAFNSEYSCILRKSPIFKGELYRTNEEAGGSIALYLRYKK